MYSVPLYLDIVNQPNPLNVVFSVCSHVSCTYMKYTFFVDILEAKI